MWSLLLGQFVVQWDDDSPVAGTCQTGYQPFLACFQASMNFTA